MIDFDEHEADAVLTEVENLRRERDSGAGIDLTAISSLTWQLVLMWDAAVENHERNLRVYAKFLFEALAARGI